MTRDAVPPGGIGGEASALSLRAAKSASAFRTISEVATELDVPQHVLRFWETKFNQIKPLKRGGGRRYYRPEDIELLRAIRALLYNDGYTIKGVQKLLRDGGTKSVRGTRSDAERPQDAAKDVPAKDIKVRREPVFVAEPLANRTPAGQVAAPSSQGPAGRASLDDETRASLKALLGELQALRDLFQK